MTPAVLVMARAPEPGVVKRRLEPLLGPDGCAMLQARLVARAARVATEAAPGAAFVSVDPPRAVDLLPDLVGDGVTLFGQPPGDAGERRAAACAYVFERVGGPVVLLSPDVPAASARHVAAALAVLEDGRDAAIGPTLDGGCYAIAVARPLPELFARSPGAPEDEGLLGLTLAAARTAGLRVGLIEPARELATPEDARVLLEDGALPEEIAALVRHAAA